MSPQSKPGPPAFPEDIRPLEPERVREIAALLPERPKGLGAPITDREAWGRLAQENNFQKTALAAVQHLREPMPELTEDIYLDHVRTGGEKLYNAYARTARPRFAELVLAEGLRDESRFLPAIHGTIHAFCGERTWVHAFHDPALRNWRGEAVEVDLDASKLSHALATADHFLGDRLDSRTRRLIRAEIRRRISEPFGRMLDGERIMLNQPKPFSWLEATHNWNPAALLGVVGSALALVESREERACCIAAAGRYTRNYLAGFPEDGSCSEGIGYWSGGFGHFVMLAETIWQATQGRLDLLADEQVELIAQYGVRLEIMPRTYPAFADCVPNTVPSCNLMRFLSQRYGLGLTGWESREPEPSTLQEVGIFAFPNSASEAGGRAKGTGAPELRSWYPDAGLYVGRPKPRVDGAIGVALKGGHNAEHHNHNDLGSFVVAVNGKLLLTDPGSEHYTSRTFFERRYESNVLNSYGHPVPVVAGELQESGRAAEAPVLRREFTGAQDMITFDLAPGYDVPDLQRLERTFVFSREALGSLAIIDEATFCGPQSFGVAMITFDQWQQTGPTDFLVFDGDNSLRIDVRATGGELELVPETIEEDVRVDTQPTRIGIYLKAPTREARIEIRIEQDFRP